MQGNQLHYIDGLMHSIHDWRFLFVIFGIEILGIIYLLHRSNRSAHFVILLVALQVVHEILYLHGLVPVMHWFIPNSDPFVREVIRYQWIAVGCGIAGFALSSFFFRDSKVEDGEDEGPNGSNQRESPREQREEKPDSGSKISEIREKERFGRPEILALGCIAAFLLAQQVIGYLSGYWINQEPDTSRYQGYGYVFLTTGFKGFVDLWLEPGARVHATHTDQPFVPLVWAFVFKVVSIFSDNPYRTDVTNHLVSGTFWGASLLGTFLLGRLLFDRRVGIYAALFLAFIPYFSFMGYLYMIDVPMVAMSVMAIFCFLKGMKDDQVAEGSAGSQEEARGLKSALWNGRYSILAGFFYLLTILTKLIGLHLIAVFAIMYFVFKKGWQWRPLLLTGAPVAIGALVVMGVLRGMYGAEWFSLVADYAGRVTEILRDLSTRPWTEYTTLYHDGPMSIFFFFRYPTAYLGFGISLLIILGLTMRDPARSNILKEKIFLVSWSLLLILYFSLAITKTTRFIYAVYPALTILAALGFCSLLRIAKGRLSVYLVLLLLLVEMGGRHISFYDSQIAQRWIKDYEIRF